MKYAIMSDAHSNPAALKLALEDARVRGCGKFLFLGDVTGYGYDVKTTLDLVRENFDVVIMGNHDAVCCGAEDTGYTRVNPHYDLDRAQGAALSETDAVWLHSLPYTCENGDFIASHGDFVNPPGWGYIIDVPEAMASFRKCGRELMFCGHTHHACVWELAGGKLGNRFEERFRKPALRPESVTFALVRGSRFIVNVGSVGYPRHDLCCSYAIYDSETRRVTIRRLPFDFKGYVLAMLSAEIALPRWLNEILMMALKEK